MITFRLDWIQLAVAAAPFIVLLTLKFLLDLKLANFIVKYLFWIPVRNFFREKPIQLNGNWEHQWSSGGSDSFALPTSRHGYSSLRQWGRYCYAEFYSSGEKYAVFGKIQGDYIVGDWYDVNDPRGYFGVIQLEIVTSSFLKGQWLGHSKHGREIRGDVSQWTKLK